jgi:hypothetical protein
MVTTERGENETAKAYEAFKAYAEMGAGRSLDAVGRKLGKSTTLMERWSSVHGWKERVALWDNRRDHVQQTAEEKAAEAVALRLAERRAKVQESAYEMFEKLKAKCDDMLQFPVGRRESKDGKTIVHPAKWNFADLARVATVADALGRMATGLATSRQELSGPDGKPFTLPGPSSPVTVVLRTSEDEDTAAARARFGPKPQ